MAKTRLSGLFSGLAGRVGNAVIVHTPDGTVVRERPYPHRRTPSEPARAAQVSLRRANAAWRALTLAQVQAWREFAAAEAEAEGRAYEAGAAGAPNRYRGLACKRWQIDAAAPALLEPPVGDYLGDVVRLRVDLADGGVTVRGDRANDAGTVTEILAQRLPSHVARPRPRSYVSQGFRALTLPEEAWPLDLTPGPWALAARFVERSTGRSTAVRSLGVVEIEADPVAVSEPKAAPLPSRG